MIGLGSPVEHFLFSLLVAKRTQELIREARREANEKAEEAPEALEDPENQHLLACALRVALSNGGNTREIGISLYKHGLDSKAFWNVGTSSSVTVRTPTSMFLHFHTHPGGNVDMSQADIDAARDFYRQTGKRVPFFMWAGPGRGLFLWVHGMQGGAISVGGVNPGSFEKNGKCKGVSRGG